MKKIFQIEGIISIILGLLLLLIPSNVIISVLQFILGLVLVFIYLPMFLINMYVTKDIYVKIKSLIFTILGFVIMIFGFNIVGSVIGTTLIIFLLIDLINSDNKLETFKSDLIKYILAVVLIVVGINKVIDIVILVSGLLLVVVGIIKLITDSIDTRKTFKHKKEETKQTLNENIIDVEFEKHEE